MGRSTPTVPTATTAPGLPSAKIELLAASTTVSTNAPARLPSVSAMCIGRRRSRGANASISTPASAAAKTSSIGREQAPLDVRGRDGRRGAATIRVTPAPLLRTACRLSA